MSEGSAGMNSRLTRATSSKTHSSSPQYPWIGGLLISLMR
jgi:hypothetical protein